ncbi:MAG: NADH-quinone oxidoreductase subunit N [Planctomycetota bacterium]
MIEKLAYLWPEITLFAGTCLVMLLGLSPNAAIRKTCLLVTLGTLALGGILGSNTPSNPDAILPDLIPFGKGMIASVGIILVLLMSGVVDREEEDAIAAGRTSFNPLRTTRAEFYAFILFSLTGLMLTTTADSLIWLFLALELTSLPTYVMVTISTRNTRSQEAGIKYFFLGALGAAIFLYGFALLYGGTGTTKLAELHEVFASGEGVNSISIAGLVLSIIGVSFKIAAVPMHFYTADVYQGASSSVSAFLAFVPKTAGFITLMLLLGAVGWDGGLPEPVRVLLWTVAVLTMTIGNVLALLQGSVKRILAYSSIAHSGYMLVGLIAGPGDGSFTENGLAAVLLYLLAYGITNAGTFAVLASLERRAREGGHEEIDSVEDLFGLCKTHPGLGWTMVLCAGSLLGLPPLLGFFAKLPLFTSAISAGEITLVVILGLNSAIAAFYYLRLMGAALLKDPDALAEPVSHVPFPTRSLAGVLAAGGVVSLSVFVGSLMDATGDAATLGDPGESSSSVEPAEMRPETDLPEAAVTLNDR